MGPSPCIPAKTGGSCCTPRLWVSNVPRMVSGIRIVPSPPVAGGKRPPTRGFSSRGRGSSWRRDKLFCRDGIPRSGRKVPVWLRAKNSAIAPVAGGKNPPTRAFPPRCGVKGLGGLDVFRSCPWGPGSGRPCHPRPVAFGLAEEAGVVCEYRAPPPAKFWVKSWKLHASKF